jgi:hippurate hydrolase
MVKEGIMDRFAIEEVYGLHTDPDAEAGAFRTCAGPLLASVAEFTVDIAGVGGHAAYPEMTRDPVAAALQIGQALTTIVARNAAAADRVVVSLTQIHSGSAFNIVPATAQLNGTVRTFRSEVQQMVERRMREICAGTGAAMGVTAELTFSVDVPATVNHADQAAFAALVAREVAGADRVDDAAEPEMGGEDFSFMLEARPGAFLFLGQGKGPFCHHPAFDFNDAVAPVGASFFARLVERRLPLG